MTKGQQLLAEYRHEMSNTRKFLERVPEDKLAWKPHAKSMTLGRLAGHVAELPSWAVHTLKADSFDVAQNVEAVEDTRLMTSPAGTVARFDGWVRDSAAALEEISDEAWGELWRLKARERVLLELPRGAIMRTLVLNHMIHHRAQLGVYLRLLDVAVPGCYGPSNDEMSPAVTPAQKES